MQEPATARVHRALSFSGSDGGESRRVSLDDERLTAGVHQLESHAGEQRRWTKGETRLDPRFWDGLLGEVALLVSYDRTTIRGWTAPVRQSEAVKPKLQMVRGRDAA